MQGPAPDLAPAIAKLYVSNGSQALGYRIDTDGGAVRVCNEQISLYYGGNIATDKLGNLLVPGSDASYGNGVTIYQGPQLCGHSIGQVAIRAFGYTVDAASLNALTGKIVFAAVPPFSLRGGVFVCRMTGMCSSLYTGQYIGDAISVAIDSAGDCWAVVEFYPTSYQDALEYFPGCRHTGVLATGWVNASGGGLDVDEHGNVLSISQGSTYSKQPSTLTVYRGCKPNCTKIGGPFRLGHYAKYGHVNRDSTLFASGNEGFVDVYSYSPTAVKRRMTFAVGGDQSSGVAFTPGR